MSPPRRPGAEAIETKGFIKAHVWLIGRRLSQLAVLGAFLLGPLTGLWLVKGNLSYSLTLDTLPLTDPFVLLQTIFAGHWPENTALLGGVLLATLYIVIGGRVFCAYVCPMNIVTDAAHWLTEKLGLPKGWQPRRELRLWIMGAALLVSLLMTTAAWELINPVAMLHRGLIYGFGMAWVVVLAIFIFDAFLSRRGWCGHLCPMGAFYGLLGKISLVRMNAKNRTACDDCMDCFAVCPEPHVITPALKGEGSVIITSGDCTNCGRCIDVCPRDVFALGLRFNKKQETTPSQTETRKAA